MLHHRSQLLSGCFLISDLVVTAGTQFMTPDKKVRIAGADAPTAAGSATVAAR